MQVFISYSRKDLAFVEQLADDLKKAGVDVWYDVSGIRGGTRWRVEIENAVRNSQCTIVVLSPDSIASEWVDREFLFASNLKRKIIPLYYRPCELPLSFLDLNYIDVQGDNYQENFNDLLRALDQPPASLPVRPPARKRLNTYLAVLSVVLVVIGVAIGSMFLKQDDVPTPEPGITEAFVPGPSPTFPDAPSPVSEIPMTSQGTSHCDKPTTPVLVSPKDLGFQPNHYYGEGEPWEFTWLESTCEGGAVLMYHIVVEADGAFRPAVDEYVEEPGYTDDTTGTVSASKWTWKVRALDDRNVFSDWSETRTFYVPAWDVVEVNPGEKAYIEDDRIIMEPGVGFIFHSMEVTSGVGSDRDIWWNGWQFVPRYRMCSMDLVGAGVALPEITGSCILKFEAVEPRQNEAFLIEIVRSGQTQYAIVRVLSLGCTGTPLSEAVDCSGAITFEWLYPFSP